MKKIIIVTGYPAAGKSTFSEELSRQLNIPCFKKDLIKEVMSDGFGIENKELLFRDKKCSVATFMLMLHIAEQFLQTGNACILESNFQTLYPLPVSENKQIENLLEKYNCECLTFLFKGNLDVISERYFNRDNERHWTHGRAAEKDSIKNYCISNHSKDFILGTTINVDTTSFEDVDFNGLFEIARNFIPS